MRKPLTYIVTVFLFSASVVAWQARSAQPSQAPQPSQASQPSMDEILAAVRSDLVNNHADTMAKNMNLTSDQAAKFWPMYANYQKEQSAIIDAQLQGIKSFVEKFDTLDDASAMTLIKAHFGRDADMAKLREKWLGEFQKVLGTKLAVRAMQIDRRVSLIQQFQLTTQIPLAQ
jgi:hypothetical protein